MAGGPIAKLSRKEQQELWDDLNYLNTGEIKSFCKQHSIPYRIAIETRDGGRRSTSHDDRKGVMLDNVRHFLKTGVAPAETRFPADVVCFDPLPQNLTAGDRLFYGQYDKANRAMVALLKDLTDGQFKNGAVARILARDFWNSGQAPTFQEYASAWLRSSNEHTRPNPEWAFLSDRSAKRASLDWKKLRAAKATEVLKLLRSITP
jgi:hypothetical protein